MSFRVLPIRFAFAKPAPVPKRHQDYYRNICGVMFDTQEKKPEVVCAPSLPLSAERSITYDSVYELLVEAASTGEADNLLIDVGGPDEKDVASPPVIIGLLMAISTILKHQAQVTIGVLLAVTIDPSDHIYSMLEQQLENPRVRLLAASGEAQGTYFAGRPPSAGQVIAWSANARRQPIEGLKHKLVRRVGQYKLPDAEQVIRNFYDGHRAFDEIYELIVAWLAEQNAERPISRLSYDVRHSEWFRGPVEAALRDAGMQDVSSELVEPGETPEVLLLPIVRTGRSLTAWLQSDEDRQAKPPIVWSLLSAQNPVSEESGVRRLQVPILNSDRTTMVAINYALRVDADAKSADSAFWQTCPIEALDPGAEDLGAPFSADTMWGMIFEAGVIPERTVPRRRPPIGFVPDFGKITELNGSLIAAKVEALLDQKYASSLPPSLAFFCPKEDHAKALAGALQGLAGHDTFMIGRELIEAFVESSQVSLPLEGPAELQLTEISDKLQRLSDLAQRISRRERPQIVLLDEFNTSGSTFSGLYNLAHHFHLPVLCAISLARYAPTRGEMPIQQHALYDMGPSH